MMIFAPGWNQAYMKKRLTVPKKFFARWNEHLDSNHGDIGFDMDLLSNGKVEKFPLTSNNWTSAINVIGCAVGFEARKDIKRLSNIDLAHLSLLFAPDEDMEVAIRVGVRNNVITKDEESVLRESLSLSRDILRIKNFGCTSIMFMQ